MTNFRTLRILFLAFALVGLSSCDKDDDSTSGSATLAPTTVNDKINITGSLSTLEAALKIAPGDLPETLKGSGPFTVFAPNNAAFDALAAEAGFETSADLMANIDPALLAQILTYHVVEGENNMGSHSDKAAITAVSGDEIAVTISKEGKVQLLDATKLPKTNPVAGITTTNPDAANGIIHIIDKVLLPQEAITALEIDIRPSILDWATNTDDLSKLESALVKTGLVETIQGLESATILAPTDQAFEGLMEVFGHDYDSLEDFDNEAEIALLGDILKYHVLPAANGSADLMAGSGKTAYGDKTIEIIADGDGFSFMDATGTPAGTVTANIEVKNGAIHTIDKVLLPQAALDFIELLGSDDLATIVTGTAQLSLLEEALIATDLADVFADATNAAPDSTATNYNYFKPATVFAPTDDAFQALLNVLGDDYTGIDSFDTDAELALLKEILLYHVVAGKVTSADLTAGTVTTAAESDIEIIAAIGTGTFVIGDATNDVNAKIIIADELARNGVAHVVDKVLLPQRAVDFINSLKEEQDIN